MNFVRWGWMTPGDLWQARVVSYTERYGRAGFHDVEYDTNGPQISYYCEAVREGKARPEEAWKGLMASSGPCVTKMSLGQCDWSGPTIEVWILMLMESRGPGVTKEGHGSMGLGGP